MRLHHGGKKQMSITIFMTKKRRFKGAIEKSMVLSKKVALNSLRNVCHITII